MRAWISVDMEGIAGIGAPRPTERDDAGYPAAVQLMVGQANAAIEGACIALLSKTKREELEQVVRRVEHCRLETHPSFFDFFVEGCQFKPVESHAAERVG